MKILKQLLIIFLLCLCGEVISFLLPFSFPASVLSLILLFILLALKVVKPEQIKEISEYLLAIMAFFFIPAGTQIMERFDAIKDSLLPILIITIISTILTFAVTAYTVTFLIKRMNRKENPKDE